MDFMTIMPFRARAVPRALRMLAAGGFRFHQGAPESTGCKEKDSMGGQHASGWPAHLAMEHLPVPDRAAGWRCPA